MKYLKQQNHDLCEKLKVADVKDQNQFDIIIKLEDKCKKLQGTSNMTNNGKISKKKSGLEKIAQDEVIQKLNKQVEVLAKAKESDTKKYNNMKAKLEKQVSELKVQIINMEQQLVDKEKENKLHALKVKDIMRKVHTNGEIRPKEVRDLDRLISR